MRAGKNTVAARLALLSPIPVVEVSYAAKLKQSAAAMLGCSVDDLERWKNDPRTYLTLEHEDEAGGRRVRAQLTIRGFLQRYGTEAHRDVFGEDFWLDAALPLAGLPDDQDYLSALYVVTDVRFRNEAERIDELNGFVARVIGPESETGDHPSERVLDCDLAIDNRVRDDGFAHLDAELLRLLDVIGPL
jgi:hypothetical protein